MLDDCSKSLDKKISAPVKPSPAMIQLDKKISAPAKTASSQKKSNSEPPVTESTGNAYDDLGNIPSGNSFDILGGEDGQ